MREPMGSAGGVGQPPPEAAARASDSREPNAPRRRLQSARRTAYADWTAHADWRMVQT